ncbi:MAG: permease [Methanomassiliicoccales archaeon Mx-03]|nr:MAG: permease [Methanomassiliicoccales archaeon Mx-03]
MEPLILAGLIVLGLCSGIFGALFGLGGGVIFVPVLMLIFGLEPTEAVAISLIGIIAGSVGASTVLVDRGLSNVRLGLLLEITTCVGAIAGAIIATYLDSWILMVLFSVIIIYSGIRMIVNPERTVEPSSGEDTPLTFRYRDESVGEDVRYEVQNVGSGMGLCTIAGALSSMTGVGGGAVKVPLMNIHMHVPMKAASSTSSYMIGITAFSGAITYFFAGEVILAYAACVAIGAFAGSLIGARYARKIPARHLRKYFSIVLFAMAILVLLQAGGIL